MRLTQLRLTGFMKKKNDSQTFSPLISLCAIEETLKELYLKSSYIFDTERLSNERLWFRLVYVVYKNKSAVSYYRRHAV